MELTKISVRLMQLALFVLAGTTTSCGKDDGGVKPPPPVDPAYGLTVDGEEVKLHDCRISAVPFNQIWDGYQRPTDQTEIAKFASWDMPADGKSITVQLVSESEIEDIRILPRSANISPQVNGKVVTFALAAARPLVVEINGTSKPVHLFPNPAETGAPEEGTAGVRYYGPGTHKPGRVKLQSNEHVYLAEGAVVFGCFYALGADNVKVTGRGIIDSSQLERGTGSILGFSDCTNVKVEGVILRDPTMWTCTFFGCDGVEVDNIKLIGLWRYNSDGIDVVNSSNVTVKNCFVRSFDDCLTVKGEPNNPGEPENVYTGDRPVKNVRFSNCVVLCDWNKALEIGADTSTPYIEDVVFEDIDIIRTTHAAMDILHGDRAAIRNVTFNNIRVEIDDYNMTPKFQTSKDDKYTDDPGDNYCPMLIELAIEQSMWSQDPQMGTIDNVTFSNITVYGNHKPKSSFKGANATNRIAGVNIRNLVIGGQKITSAAEAGLSVGSFVSGVTFQ